MSAMAVALCGTCGPFVSGRRSLRNVATEALDEHKSGTVWFFSLGVAYFDCGGPFGALVKARDSGGQSDLSLARSALVGRFLKLGDKLLGCESLLLLSSVQRNSNGCCLFCGHLNGLCFKWPADAHLDRADTGQQRAPAVKQLQDVCQAKSHRSFHF